MKETIPRVAVVTNMIAPYRVPLFNSLADADDLSVQVFFLAEVEANRGWAVHYQDIAFNYQVVPGIHGHFGPLDFPLHLNWGLWRALSRFNPDVVVTSGYSTLGYWEAFLFARVRRRRYVLWNGTTLLSAGRLRGPIGWAKRFLFRRADACLTYGSKASEYAVHMGLPLHRVITGRNTVDMDHYRSHADQIRSSPGFTERRAQYPELLLLYVGQLIPRKGVFTLLEAVQGLDPDRVGLVVVGSGPLEKSIHEYCTRAGMDNVYFEGFVQKRDLPSYYALADVLVLPSLAEVWGLVVNEALASGLYVLCSDRAGVAHDALVEGWNGERIDPTDADALARRLNSLIEHVDDLRTRREQISRWAAEELSIDRYASQFRAAIELALSSGTDPAHER